MPNSIRSYCIPILFIPYVMLSLVRFGNYPWQSKVQAYRSLTRLVANALDVWMGW